MWVLNSGCVPGQWVLLTLESSLQPHLYIFWRALETTSIFKIRTDFFPFNFCSQYFLPHCFPLDSVFPLLMIKSHPINAPASFVSFECRHLCHWTKLQPLPRESLLKNTAYFRSELTPKAVRAFHPNPSGPLCQENAHGFLVPFPARVIWGCEGDGCMKVQIWWKETLDNRS